MSWLIKKKIAYPIQRMKKMHKLVRTPKVGRLLLTKADKAGNCWQCLKYFLGFFIFSYIKMMQLGRCYSSSQHYTCTNILRKCNIFFKGLNECSYRNCIEKFIIDHFQINYHLNCDQLLLGAVVKKLFGKYKQYILQSFCRKFLFPHRRAVSLLFP